MMLHHDPVAVAPRRYAGSGRVRVQSYVNGSVTSAADVLLSNVQFPGLTRQVRGKARKDTPHGRGIANFLIYRYNFATVTICKSIAFAIVLQAMRSRSNQIDTTLKQQGIRVTQARRSIYDALQRSSDPLSAAQIDEALQSTGISIDLVTVYRTLDTLERRGLVARVDRPSDGWRYAIRTKNHHHLIVCSECGGASPLDRCELQRIETELTRSTGFSNISHSLQFFGTCPKCQE